MKAEELRKSILQQAIQGKLVKQNPTDEPASVLLERIKAEKEKLVKEGKIKKDKAESYIFKGDDNRYYEKIGKNAPVDITDELPFEIPETWTWIRIKTVANLYNGNSISDIDKKKKYAIEKGYNFVATKDVGFDCIIRYDNSIHIPFETNFKIAPTNKILLCIEGGSAGRKVAITKDDVCFGNKLVCFDTYFTIDKYLFYYIQSPELQKIFKDSLSGMIGGVSINKLKEFFMPLPSLAEQERIVKRIEELMPLVDEYARLEIRDKELDEKLPGMLKQSILQYAMEGKLVKQDPNDEPASVLLERIKAEKEKLIKEGKIKRDKNETVIIQDDDKNYYEKIMKNNEITDISSFIYDIPNNWNWCTLSNLTRLITDGTHKTPNYLSQGIPFVSIQNISKGYFDSSKIKYISQKEHDELSKRCKPELNDILLCRIGTLGKPFINTLNFEFSIFVSLALIKIIDKFDVNYLSLVLSSPQINKYIDFVKVGGGTHTNKINIESLSTFPIPLPPINEQIKIVAKYNDLIDILKII